MHATERLVLIACTLGSVQASESRLRHTISVSQMIVAGEGATFNDLPDFAGGIVPGDGIFTTWSYRAGAGRAEAFLLNPQPLTTHTAHQWESGCGGCAEW